MTENEAVEAMKQELEKPKKEQNKALILKVQRRTFNKRRQFLPSVRDGDLQCIVQKYPVLSYPEFVSSTI